jgi:hypothetical protein
MQQLQQQVGSGVVMEAVAIGGSPLKPFVQALQQHQQQQRAVSSGSSLRSTHKQQQEQEQEQVKVVMSSAEMMSSAETGDSSAEDDESSGDEDDAILQPPSLAQQQQQGLAGKRSAPEASRKAAAAATAAAEVDAIMRGPPSALGLDGPMPLELQSCNSASSISSRGSPGFYNRRGAGSGASRDLELFVRLNRARQTLDFAKRQAQAFAELDKAELTVWKALDLLDGLREYEAALLHAAASTGSGGGSAQDDAQLTPDMPLKEHAFQVRQMLHQGGAGLFETWACRGSVGIYWTGLWCLRPNERRVCPVYGCVECCANSWLACGCRRWLSCAGCRSLTSPGWLW